MKKTLKYLISFLMAVVMVLPLAACGGGNGGGSDEPPVGGEPFGITQRPDNDLEDYADLRPDRKPFVDNAQPDEGVLTDHIYEFEEMNSAGSSRDKDHLCNAKSFVTSPDFSGFIALENIDAGVSFTLTLESDKAVRVPMLVGMNNNGKTLGEVMAITNNGRAVADTSAVVPSESKPALGAPSGYFNMVTVESAISLVEGMNRITFKLTSAGTNFDYVNIKTSANLVNHTVPAWPVPDFTVTREPSKNSAGAVKLDCSHDGCEDFVERYLPNLKHECYDVAEEGDTKTYSLTVLEKAFTVATVKETAMPEYPEDDGELKDNIFEFENAAITGGSQDVADHFCASNSIMVGGGFGGNICVENLRQNTLTFVIESDKSVCVPFVVRLSGDEGAAIENYLTIKNVTDNSAGDVSGLFSDVEYPECSFDVYFPMRTATGKINLVKGENIIEITRLNGNLDYINIRTSANLTDKTQSYWNTDHKPEFEVVKAPTASERGSISISCPTDGCTKGNKTVDLPALGNKCYIIENNAYYIILFGQKIKVCDVPAE